MTAVTATLPYPPTVNHAYVRTGTGGLALAAAGRAFRERARLEARVAFERLAGDVAVTIVAYPPDRRRRDLDNIVKGVLDSLTGAAYADDSQVARLVVVRGEGGPARVEGTVEAMA